jgi:uncharacterized protein
MFEFDPDKSAANKAKHGIDFEEAQEIWDDPVGFMLSSRHEAEARWLAIGLAKNKLWAAIFTHRADRIRIISVRRARQFEVKEYDRQKDD